jgi:hypothetical protein
MKTEYVRCPKCNLLVSVGKDHKKGKCKGTISGWKYCGCVFGIRRNEYGNTFTDILSFEPDDFMKVMFNTDIYKRIVTDKDCKCGRGKQLKTGKCVKCESGILSLEDDQMAVSVPPLFDAEPKKSFHEID